MIAFPKAASGLDPLTGAPTPITPAQRREAGIDVQPRPASLPASPPAPGSPSAAPAAPTSLVAPGAASPARPLNLQRQPGAPPPAAAPPPLGGAHQADVS